MQASFVAKEWVDHTLSKSQKAENKLATSKKALAEAKKKYKESLFHQSEVERGRKSAKAALGGAKRQAEEIWVSLKKTKAQLTSAKKKIKL